MDILNFISWIASKRRIVKTLNKTDLIPLGVRTETRDDKYTTVAITASDFVAQLPIPEPAYKVYTALLTQSGGDDVLSLDSGTLVIGTTYWIYDNSIGMDFTNVGAPNNNIGTYFVATGTTPNSWGESEGLINILRYDTGAPVVTVLENTIGNIWFTYVSPGFYLLNSLSLFTNNKTFALYTPSTLGNFNVLATQIDSINQVAIDCSDSTLTEADNLLINTPIEIRVYN